MKKPILQLIALIILTNPLLGLQALEPNPSGSEQIHQNHNEIYARVSELLKQKTDQKLFDTEFELRKLNPSLTLPKCQNPLTLKDRNPKSITGRVSVSVSCNAPNWRVFIPAVIKGKLFAVISIKGIPKHAVIKEGSIKQVKLPYQNVSKGHLIDIQTAIGMRTTKAIPPNKVLRIKDLQPAYWVFKNQQVNIITRIGAIEVKTIGTALKNGVELEHVPVRNLSSQKSMKGIVIAPNTVLIP